MDKNIKNKPKENKKNAENKKNGGKDSRDNSDSSGSESSGSVNNIEKKYYKKDKLLRNLIWIWITIILNIMILTIVHSLFGDNSNNFEFMNSELFSPLVITIGFIQLIVAIGFLYLDSIKKTIGSQENNPEDYNEWNDYMKNQANVDSCSTNSLWYSIPIVVLIITFSYNLLFLNDLIVWLMLFTILVMWIVSLLVHLMYTKHACDKNNNNMKMNDRLMDNYRNFSNKNRNCRMNHSKLDEDCSKKIKNIHSNYNHLIKTGDDSIKTGDHSIKTGDHLIKTGDHSINTGDDHHLDSYIPQNEDTNNCQKNSIDNDLIKCRKLKSVLDLPENSNFFETNNQGPKGCYIYDNNLYYNDGPKTTNLKNIKMVNLDQ